MELVTLAVACTNNSCPAVYLDQDRKVAIVQGYKVQTSTYDLDVPASEDIVEIPWSLLLAAASSTEVASERVPG